MRLVVVSHKVCWPSSASPTGYASDGGFPMQMRALSELFDETRLLVPVDLNGAHRGEIPLEGSRLQVVPLTLPAGHETTRKLLLLSWLARNGRQLFREIFQAGGVHTPIPGDIGTLGMLTAWMLGKPLFVRHCGNWRKQVTGAQHFWKWFMEHAAGAQNVMLATGGDGQPPSHTNAHIGWIFSTSLTAAELARWARPRQKASNPARLVIACRQERSKGTALVIESLALLQKTFPGILLDVIGDGEDLPRLRHLAESLHLSGQVTFHGKLDHQGVMNRIAACDLFCYPTAASEGFPKVVLEALACGLPVITTPVSVLPMIIKRGGGMLLDEASPHALANAVETALLDENYRRFSAAAVEIAAGYSLEAWRDAIGAKLNAAWGALKHE